MYHLFATLDVERMPIASTAFQTAVSVMLASTATRTLAVEFKKNHATHQLVERVPSADSPSVEWSALALPASLEILSSDALISTSAWAMLAAAMPFASTPLETLTAGARTALLETHSICVCHLTEGSALTQPLAPAALILLALPDSSATRADVKIPAKESLAEHTLCATPANACAPRALPETRRKAANHLDSAEMIWTALSMRSASNWAREGGSAWTAAPNCSAVPMLFAFRTTIVRLASARMDTLETQVICPSAASPAWRAPRANARRTPTAQETLSAWSLRTASRLVPTPVKVLLAATTNSARSREVCLFASAETGSSGIQSPPSVKLHPFLIVPQTTTALPSRPADRTLWECSSARLSAMPSLAL